MNLPEMLSISATAKILNKSIKTIRRWIADGKVDAAMVGNKYLIPKEEVERLNKKVDILKKENCTIVVKDEKKITKKEEYKIEKLSLDMMKKLLPILDKEGIIAEVLDFVAIKKYCYYVQASEYLLKKAEKEGWLTMETNLSLKVHPFSTLALQYEKLALSYADRLGLNPKARNALSIKKKEEKEEMAGLIC